MHLYEGSGNCCPNLVMPLSPSDIILVLPSPRPHLLCLNHLLDLQLYQLMFQYVDVITGAFLYCNIIQSETGRLVGNIDYRAVRISRKRLHLKMEKDMFLKQKFETITNDLSRMKTCPLFSQ